MPTVIEYVAYGLIGGATALSTYRLAKIFIATRKKQREETEGVRFRVEMDTSSFTATMERMSQEMERRVQDYIGGLTTEDVLQMLMGRRVADAIDEEAIHGTEESIPPDVVTSTAIPPTWRDSDDVTPQQNQMERLATQIAATLGVPFDDATRALERAIEEGTFDPSLGELPFIDPATGRLVANDPGLPPLHPWMRQDRCYACPRYDEELGPEAMANVCRGHDDHQRDWRTICSLYDEWLGQLEAVRNEEDLAPSDVQTDARVEPRCPWMTTETCDVCARRIDGILPGTQAVLCAGLDTGLPQDQEFACALFQRWRDEEPVHFLLEQVHIRERQIADAGKTIRVIRFPRRE